MSLLDPLFLTTVSQVLTFGAQKYAAHNWRKGLEVSRLLDAALRHLNAFNDGQDLDPESGISHLGHASCCLMFAMRMVQDRPELDDRYKPETKEVDRTEVKKMFDMQPGHIPAVYDSKTMKMVCPSGYYYSPSWDACIKYS
jgi:hypothetical protein